MTDHQLQPLPATDTPEALRYAAAVLEWIPVASPSPSSPTYYSAPDLRSWADRLERERAARAQSLERVAIRIYQEHEMGIRGDGAFQPWDQRTEGSKNVFRRMVEVLDDEGWLNEEVLAPKAVSR